jgi:hypothetical protein
VKDETEDRSDSTFQINNFFPPVPKLPDWLQPFSRKMILVMYRYNVCSTVWCLSIFMISAGLFDVCLTIRCCSTYDVCLLVWGLPTCMISACLYTVCPRNWMVSTHLYGVSLPVMRSAYLYPTYLFNFMVSANDVFPPLRCLPTYIPVWCVLIDRTPAYMLSSGLYDDGLPAELYICLTSWCLSFYLFMSA